MCGQRLCEWYGLGEIGSLPGGLQVRCTVRRGRDVDSGRAANLPPVTNIFTVAGVGLGSISDVIKPPGAEKQHNLITVWRTVSGISPWCYLQLFKYHAGQYRRTSPCYNCRVKTNSKLKPLPRNTQTVFSMFSTMKPVLRALPWETCLEGPHSSTPGRRSGSSAHLNLSPETTYIETIFAWPLGWSFKKGSPVTSEKKTPPHNIRV